MPHLSPQPLTFAEQRDILRATARNHWDHLIDSLTLGTGRRLAEIVGLNVGDVYLPNGMPRTRIRRRPELVKGGRAADVFLPRRVQFAFRTWQVKDGFDSPYPFHALRHTSHRYS